MITSSRPVVIPRKSRNLNSSSRQTPTRPSINGRDRHKTDAIPPSVAALLAVTSFSPPAALRKHNVRRRRSTDFKFRSSTPISPFLEPRSPESVDLDGLFCEKSPLLSRSSSKVALDVLLGPPECLEDPLSVGSPPESTPSIRSVSSESVPSLSADDEYGMLSWSGPTTPLGSRKAHQRKYKTFSPPQDSVLDHPLLPKEQDEIDDDQNDTVEAASFTNNLKETSTLFSKLSFKSNLTASLRVLKSAAKSFSNLSVPMIQPEDFLTRSILSISPQYNTDERMPAYHDIPPPAMRRYLNPPPKHDTHDHAEACTTSIQMQTYNTKISPQQIITSEPDPAVRPREVRENSDFLRVIVLEMNMRRGGKLSDTAQGKARFILPPRQTGKSHVIGDATRWVALEC